MLRVSNNQKGSRGKEARKIWVKKNSIQGVQGEPQLKEARRQTRSEARSEYGWVGRTLQGGIKHEEDDPWGESQAL